MYNVKLTFKFETQADRDGLFDYLKNKTNFAWEENNFKIVGATEISGDFSYDTEEERNEVFDYVKSYADTKNIKTGFLCKHKCGHDIDCGCEEFVNYEWGESD